MPYKALYKVEDWSGKHDTILVQRYRDVPVEKIAEKLSVHPNTVRKVIRHPEFIRRLREMSERGNELVVKKETERNAKEWARLHLSEAAEKAALMVKDIALEPIKNGKGKFANIAEKRLKLEACKDILDRAGLKPVDVVETRERSYAPEEIEAAKAALIEMEGIEQRLSNKGSKFVLTSVTKAESLELTAGDSVTEASPQLEGLNGSSERTIED